jgi:hypothetical protein
MVRSAAPGSIIPFAGNDRFRPIPLSVGPPSRIGNDSIRHPLSVERGNPLLDSIDHLGITQRLVRNLARAGRSSGGGANDGHFGLRERRAAGRWRMHRCTRAPPCSRDVRRLDESSMSEELETRVQFLRDVNVDAREHSGRGLLDHLLGTRQLLLKWGARPALCGAGLFHSIHGTEGYQEATVPLSMRARVRELIGNEAESLVWLFCFMRRERLSGNVGRRGDLAVASPHRGAVAADRRAVRRFGESHIRQRVGAVPSNVADVAPGGFGPIFKASATWPCPGHGRDSTK